MNEVKDESARRICRIETVEVIREIPTVFKVKSYARSMDRC